MPDINQLPAGSTPAGPEKLAAWQGGATVSLTAAQVAALGGGATGPTGPAGPTGATGPTGPTGPSGSVPLPFFGNKPVSGWSRPTLATFATWLNQNDGTSDAAATDGAGGLPLIVSGAADISDYLVSAVLKPAPAPPWTIKVGMAAYGGAAALTYPLIIRDNAGKGVGIGWTGINQGAANIVSVSTWGNFDASPAGPNQADDGTILPPFSDYFMWFRAIFDGTHFTSFAFGPDGVIWQEMLGWSTALNGFLGTIASVGFGIDRNTGNSAQRGIISAILWDWEES